jgi:hypothetical protein
MAKYTISAATPAAAANAAAMNLWTPAARSARVVRIDFVITANTASTMTVVRTTARGTQTTTATPQAIDPLSAASTSAFDTAWSVQPTFAATPMATFPLPASIGAGFTLIFDDADPLVVAAAAGIAIRNVGGASASAGWATILFDEG